MHKKTVGKQELLNLKWSYATFQFLPTSMSAVFTCIPLRVFIIGIAFRNSGSHWSLLMAKPNHLNTVIPASITAATTITMLIHGLTQLLLGLFKRMLKVGTGIWRSELKDKAALGWSCCKLQLCGQEAHAEGQGLFLWQFPVYRCQQVFYGLIKRLSQIEMIKEWWWR